MHSVNIVHSECSAANSGGIKEQNYGSNAVPKMCKYMNHVTKKVTRNKLHYIIHRKTKSVNH